MKKFYGRYGDLVGKYSISVWVIIGSVFVSDSCYFCASRAIPNASIMPNMTPNYRPIRIYRKLPLPENLVLRLVVKRFVDFSLSFFYVVFFAVLIIIDFFSNVDGSVFAIIFFILSLVGRNTSNACVLATMETKL